MPSVHRLDAAGRELVLAALSRELARRDEMAFAYVFGSFLHTGGFRDIDIGVWMTHADRHTDLDLAVALSHVAGFPVDVRVANGAPTAFLFHMFQGRPLVVKDERLLADLLERTVHTYHDQAPLVRAATRDAFAA